MLGGFLHASMGLHIETSLIAFLHLMHFRIAPAPPWHLAEPGA